MRQLFRILLLLSCVLTLSCKKDDGGTQPSQVILCGTDDFAFPSQTGLRATLYSECDQVSVGTTFFVKLVLHNVTDAFGATAEFSFANDKISIEEGVLGPAFSPAADVIVLGGVTPNSDSIYAIGVTYKAGTGRTTNGSGVVAKIKCKATAAGTATFVLDPSRLEIRKSDGSLITGFGSIQIESATITIQ